MHEHLLYVKKTSVGRTHSLPNDSYMFLPLQPNAPHSTHKTSSHLAQTGKALKCALLLCIWYNFKFIKGDES